MRRTNGRKLAHYVVAALSVVVAFGATKMLQRIDDKPTLFIFLGAIMVSAAVGGLVPGLVALGMSAAVSAFFVLQPVDSFSIEGFGAIARWLSFQAIGLLIVWMQASRRATANRLAETDRRLHLALEAGRVGVWDYSQDSGDLWVSKSVGNLFGHNPAWFTPTFDEFLNFIHPDDREFFHQSVLRTITDRVDYEVDFRIVQPNGSIRWLVSRGRGYHDHRGRRIVGVISENAAKGLAGNVALDQTFEQRGQSVA